MFRIALMNPFISLKVTGFHLRKRLFGFSCPCRSSVAIRSDAYLYTLSTLLKVCDQHLQHILYLFVSSTRSVMVSSPKKSLKNSTGG